MVKKHLSRLNAPKSWPIRRKGIKWITRPSPGPHALRKCIPLDITIKSILKYAKTNKEIKKILNEGKILVDTKARKDHKFPLGIMDVLAIPETKEHFRVLYDSKGKFTLIKISSSEAKTKPAKIIGKKILPKKKTQLNFNDGRNLLTTKTDLKVGDTIMLELGEKAKLKKHLKLEKGSLVYLTEGRYKGESGKIEDIKQIFGNPTIKIKSKDKTFETSKNFALVIDSSISLGDKK